MKNIRIYIALILGFILENQSTFAQTIPTYSLEQLTDIAIRSNKGLTIKQLQIEEKRTKEREDEIKRLPVVSLSSTYQYNLNLADITIPAGAIGVIPINETTQVPLPNTDRNITLGKNNNFNVGLTAYQPISQQAKIKTGIEVSKVETQVSEQEKQKVSLQLKHGIEQLYYATLIAQKQQEEAQAKLNLANSRLKDLENALEAGKTLDINKVGLLASIADEEQNILKLDFQIQNYKADIAKLAGLPDENFSLANYLPEINSLSAIQDYKSGISANPDVQIANLTKNKAELGIKAAKLSDRPDMGLIAGYAFQSGNPLAPANNPFIGVNLKWNLQDLYANKQIQKQRLLQKRQAEENIGYTKEQLSYEVEKAYRKAQQSKSLINVAEKALKYRQEELKLQEDKQLAGMNLKTDILSTKAVLAKAETDVYAAKLAYLIALSDLDALIGQ